MKKIVSFSLLIIFLSFQIPIAQARKLNLKTTTSRNREVKILKQKAIDAKRNALEVAKKNRWKIKGLGWSKIVRKWRHGRKHQRHLWRKYIFSKWLRRVLMTAHPDSISVDL